jgi:hypothetical protein
LLCVLDGETDQCYLRVSSMQVNFK